MAAASRRTPMSSPAPAHSRRAGTRPSIWTALLFVVVVIGVPVLTTTLSVARFDQLSALDEFGHIDYLRRIESGEVPRMGDKVLPETARDVACRTIAGRPVSDCELDEIPIEDIDAEGYSYQAQQPPLYYVITAVLRQPISLFVDGFVNSARLTGAVWSAAGLGLLWWYLRRRMGATPVMAAIACLLISLAPLVVSQTATVNNDAAGLLIGASCLVGYDRLRRDPRLVTAGVVAAGFAALVLIKPLAVLPVGAVSLGLLADPTIRASGWRRVAGAMVPAIAAGVTYQAWQAVRDLRAIVPYDEVVDVLLRSRAPVTEFPFEELPAVSARFLTVFQEAVGTFAGTPYVRGVAATVAILFVYAPSISAAMGQSRRQLQPLHIGLIAVVVVAPPLLVAMSYFGAQQDGGANPRYALSLLPLFVTALMPWVERRAQQVVVGVAALSLLAVTLIALV